MRRKSVRRRRRKERDVNMSEHNGVNDGVKKNYASLSACLQTYRSTSHEVRSWFLCEERLTYLSITPIFGNWRIDLRQRW